MAFTPSNPTGRAIDDPRATAYDRVPEGEVPPFPPSNPRNATDETGKPRNPAVSHPLPSKGFPDNDGDMASAPVDQEFEHPDGTRKVIHHAGVVKPRDVPDEELPEEQRADPTLGGMDYRERYERDHPDAVAEDPSEPWGQPVDKYGYPLRKGADPDAQSTGDSNPDNPDRETKSDRYLGEETMKETPDGTPISNAKDSANDGQGFPKREGAPEDASPVQAGAGADGHTNTSGNVTGQFIDPFNDPADPTTLNTPPVVREHSTMEDAPDTDENTGIGGVNPDGTEPRPTPVRRTTKQTSMKRK